MDKGSLPVWVIILIIGVLIIMLLGVFNPFIKREDKKKVRKLNAYKLTNGDKTEIDLRFHFKGLKVYPFIVLFFCLAALISLFIEDYSTFQKIALNSGTLSCVLAVIGVIFLFFLGGIIFIIIPLIAEDLAIASIATQYRKNSNVKINNNGYDQK